MGPRLRKGRCLSGGAATFFFHRRQYWGYCMPFYIEGRLFQPDYLADWRRSTARPGIEDSLGGTFSLPGGLVGVYCRFSVFFPAKALLEVPPLRIRGSARGSAGLC